MPDFKTLFEGSMPVKDSKPCNEIWEIEATTEINKRMDAFQREFTAKSEMSQSKAAGFHFSC